MSDREPTPTEGWAFPDGARKAHYFVDSMALCRKYGFYRGAFLVCDPNEVSPDDCAQCVRLYKRRAKT